MKRTEVTNPFFMRRKNSTPAIFYVDDNRDPDHWGSCTLVTVANHYFLVTAAHVLDAWANTSGYLPHEKGFIELKSLFFFTTPLPQTKNRDDDTIDIGYVEITPTSIPEDIRTLFIGLADIAVIENREDKRWFGVIGHPLSKTSRDKVRRQVKLKKPFTFTTIQSSSDKQRKVSFPADSYLLHFQQRKVFTDDQILITAPKPKGISGGAVWELPIVDNKHAVDQKERLVAIVTECRKELNMLVATNIKRVLFSIASYYPDTRDDLRKWLAPNA